MPRWFTRALLALVIGSIVLGLAIRPLIERTASADVRAEWLERAGKYARAELVYWDELQKGRVTVPVVLAFLEAHERASTMHAFTQKIGTKFGQELLPKEKSEPALSEATVDAFVRRPDLPREVSLVARYVRFGATDEEGKLAAELAAEAAMRPPMPWANHVLAKTALLEGHPREAADRYLVEGTTFGRAEDVAMALHIYEIEEDWAAVDATLDDPRAGPLAPPGIHVNRAMKARDYKRVFRWLLPFSFPTPERGPLILAVIAAFAWFSFCARLGQMQLRPAFRVPLYLGAFALGVFSIAPTMFLIVWQERVLHLVPDGTLVKDAIFYVFGVGFREELSKLLCFVPLLPLVRRWGNMLDVLACGALVGLGFAAAENLQYFAMGDLTAALGRFLTANFLHMSLTALAAAALARIGKSEEWFYEFTVAFLTVVALHGVYDFFIASPALGGEMSFLSMTVFVVLSRNFVVEMHAARLKAGRSQPMLPVFVLGLTVVTCASFVWACAVVGPATAAQVMFLGLLGVAILLIVFVRQLRAL